MDDFAFTAWFCFVAWVICEFNDWFVRKLTKAMTKHLCKTMEEK